MAHDGGLALRKETAVTRRDLPLRKLGVLDPSVGLAAVERPVEPAPPPRKAASQAVTRREAPFSKVELHVDVAPPRVEETPAIPEAPAPQRRGVKSRVPEKDDWKTRPAWVFAVAFLVVLVDRPASRTENLAQGSNIRQ
jgi:hypothetical protein